MKMQGARLVEVFDGGWLQPRWCIEKPKTKTKSFHDLEEKKIIGTKISALTEEPVLRLLLLD